MYFQGGAALKIIFSGRTLCIPFLRVHKVFLVTLPLRASKAECKKHTQDTKVEKPKGFNLRFDTLHALYKLRTLESPHCKITRLAHSLDVPSA